jgi:hypothetical protein
LFGRGCQEFGAFGGEEGERFDEAPDLVLHQPDQPFGHQPPGPRGERVDQGQHGDPESLGWGKGWDVVHTLFLHRPTQAGQAKK